MNTLRIVRKKYIFTVFLRFDKFHRHKLKKYTYVLFVDDEFRQCAVCCACYHVDTSHTHKQANKWDTNTTFSCISTNPNHDYNININIIITIILTYKYNCHLHFIKTIHLSISLVLHAHAHEDRADNCADVCIRFFTPPSTKNKFIKLNDTIMEINWKRNYCAVLPTIFVTYNAIQFRFYRFSHHRDHLFVGLFLGCICSFECFNHFNSRYWVIVYVKHNVNLFRFKTKSNVWHLIRFALTSESWYVGWTFGTTNAIAISLLASLGFEWFFFDRRW